MRRRIMRSIWVIRRETGRELRQARRAVARGWGRLGGGESDKANDVLERLPGLERRRPHSGEQADALGQPRHKCYNHSARRSLHRPRIRIRILSTRGAAWSDPDMWAEECFAKRGQPRCGGSDRAAWTGIGRCAGRLCLVGDARAGGGTLCARWLANHLAYTRRSAGFAIGDGAKLAAIRLGFGGTREIQPWSQAHQHERGV